MYDYGIIKSGSYFGDISILLKKRNTFSYFFNPHAEKPLQLLRVDKGDLKELMENYPVEKDIWDKRAKERDELFNNYKTMNLLKYIKAIIKNPFLIKENSF